ncbi:hypothetical protein J3F84DRAFT_309924 [Trichoderma pleuroticola]
MKPQSLTRAPQVRRWPFLLLFGYLFRFLFLFVCLCVLVLEKQGQGFLFSNFLFFFFFRFTLVTFQTHEWSLAPHLGCALPRREASWGGPSMSPLNPDKGATQHV